MEFVKFKNATPILVFVNLFLVKFLQFLYVKYQLSKL